MTQQPSNKSDFVFKNFLHVIFVVFSLYLMGDVFNRWDGFSYYASFSEFLPAAALALILWSIVSVLFAVSVWVVFKVFAWFGNQAGLKIKIDHLLLNASLFVIIGVLFWKGKKLIWPDVQTTFAIKLAVLLFTVFLSIYLAWLFRNRAVRWFEVVRERITPLVWIFGSLFFVSIPLVAYHTWIDNPDKTISKKKSLNYSEKNNQPNIILVTFDALAARNMSTYGYLRETTPFISEWAKNATLFSMTEASSNFTSPAAASLMTGKRLWTHQTYHIEGTKPLKSQKESLPQVLKEAGYFNIALVVNPFASVKMLGMSNSFDIDPKMTEFGNSASLFGWKYGVIDKVLYRTFGENIKMHNWIIKNDFILSKFLNLISRNIYETTVPPRKVFERFFNVTDNKMEKPFFAWLHLFPPHDPYLSPEPYKGTFSSSSKMSSYKKHEHLIEESYKYLFKRRKYPEEMQAAVSVMRDYYDEFVMYIDNEFKNFIQELDKKDYKNTIVILTADHGESFEHGYFTHGGPYLYEQVTHIPLIIKESGLTKRQVVSDVVEQVDIPATILNLVNIPVPSWMEGRSLVPLMRGEALPERPVFSMNLQENRSRGHQITKGSVAVWDGDYKLIHYLENDESLLFNIKNDPGETNNLIDREPETGQRLLNILLENIDKANERIMNGN